MGIYWRAPLKCQQPDHSRQSKGTLRTIPYNLLVYFSSKYNREFPVGSMICNSHLKIANKEKLGNSEQVIHNVPDSKFDPDYQPTEVYLAEVALENSINNVSDTAQVLDASPVRFQITKRHVEDISDKAKYYVIKKYNKANSLLKRKFAEAVALGQGHAFIAIIFRSKPKF